MPAIEIRIARGMIALRLANLRAQIADVVVAQIGVNRVHRRRAQPREKQPRPVPRARRKIKRHLRGEMRRASPDHPQHRADDADPEKFRDQADRGDPAVEKDDQDNDQRGGNSLLLIFSERNQIREVLRKSDRARSHHQRRLNQRLPDIKEGHQAPAAPGSVRLAQKRVSAAGARHRRAQFGPHQAVQQRKHSARDPRQQALRPAHRLNHQRNHDERANPHHRVHVQRDGLGQAEPAFELFFWQRCGHGRCEAAKAYQMRRRA